MDNREHRLCFRYDLQAGGINANVSSLSKQAFDSLSWQCTFAQVHIASHPVNSPSTLNFFKKKKLQLFSRGLHAT